MPFKSGPKGRVLPLLLLTVPLWACSPPQDVADVQQVVAGAGQQDADFMVQPVGAITLSMVQGWPQSHPGTGVGWPRGGGGSEDSVIANGDVLNLAVFGSNEGTPLANPIQLPNLKVSSKGTIFLPYIDEIEVAGMTADAARARIQEKLTAMVPDAQVQLVHAAGSRNAVDVVAGLPRNGNYPLASNDTTVTSILAAAGGLPEQLNNPQINLQRGGRLYRVGAKTILENPGMDAVLRGGDRIYVTPDERYFLSLGAAGKEALVNFPKDDITTLDAMSLIGGLDQGTADPKGILVLRNYPASAVAANPDRGPSKRKVVFAFDLTTADGLFAAGDFKIEDRDLVLVTQSPMVNTRTIVSFFAAMLNAGRTTALATN